MLVHGLTGSGRGGGMGFDGEVWQVGGDGGPVGEILIDEADFPWLSGRFTPGPGYDRVRGLFAHELALLERDSQDDREAWEAVYDEIRRRVSLSSPHGPVAEFLLHVDGDRAWFRWSEEPFGD